MTRKSLLAIGFGVLLVVATSVAPPAAATPTATSVAPSPVASADEPTGVNEGAPTSAAQSDDRNVTVMDAMTTAQNETNGTAIGAELERGDSRTVWEVEVLRADGGRFEVDVNARTGAVLDVQNASLFGGANEGLLPATRTRSLDRMRSAIRAVEIVRNQSVDVASISRVELEVENSSLVHEVTYSTPGGGTAEVRIPAIPESNSTTTTG